MKSTTNVFLDGLITDRHPLSTPQNCLTDALNATLLTYNGNEMMLLNDMGNTRILDSATGNIMGLSPGFIPVGMKEHGGIMYIASVNKEGEGEIGTIPSPIIRDFYKDKLQILIDKKLSNASYVSISNKIYPADKIMINLGLTVPTNLIAGDIYDENDGLLIVPSGEESVNIDPCDYYIKRVCILPPYSASDFAWNRPLKYSEVTSPIISYSPNIISSHTFNKGIFKVKLASKSIANVETEAPKSLYESQSGSNYWFHHTYDISQIFPSNLFEATLNSDLKSFPTDSKPGYLQVKLLNEGIKTFGMLQRAKHPINTPFSVKINDSKYETYFPGFYYITESGIYVAKIECEIIDQQTRELVQIILPDGSAKKSAEILFDRTLTTNPDLDLIKTVIGFKDSERDDRLSTAVINPIKSDNTISYPQVYNQERNEFYLTNITDITAVHTQYHSSTLDKDEKAIIPYSGLFKIQLDNLTYTHWHKLTVLYYNQYNEKLGKYECTFNPLLNDVFGSNILVNSIDCGDACVMGSEYILDASNQYSLSEPSHVIYVSTEPYTDKNYDSGTIYDASKCHLKSGKRRDEFQNTCIRSFKERPDNQSDLLAQTECADDFLFEFMVNDSHDISEFFLPSNYHYLYLDVDREVECKININKYDYAFIFPKEFSHSDQSCMWYCMYNRKNTASPGNWGYDLNWTNGWTIDDAGEGYLVRKAVLVINGEHKICETNCILHSGSDIPGYKSLTVPSINTESTVVYSEDVLRNECILANLSNFENGSYLVNLAYPGELSFGFGPVIGTRSPNWMDRDIAGFLYTIPEDESHSYINILVTANGTCTATVKQTAYQPLYKIVPYFILQDTNRSYISKFHLTDSLFYNCNLELGEGNTPYNYLNGSFDINEAKNDFSEFSYHQPQHKTLTEYTKITANGLDSGIYVFNISAPSITNLLKDHTLPILIRIKVGDKTTTLSPYRVAGFTLINYQRSDGYGITMTHLWPIVIYVDQHSDVEISIILDKGLELRYQQEGLYKLKDLPDLINSELIKEFNDVCGYLFPDYQLKVLDIAGKLPKEEQYPFKQTYGIFFRQAYSYVEGLYDLENDILGDLEKLSNVISSITIGATTYPNKAFVPAEPYILNYMWDKTPESKEPKVSSSCSAACLYCQPKEILTNRQETKFKFFPTMENTEDCITTQIRTFVLTDTAISCQPGNSTVLIKNNNADEN